MIAEFQLEPDAEIEPRVNVFEADESRFKLAQVDQVYSDPTESDGYGCVLWVDSMHNQTIIQRKWW